MGGARVKCCIAHITFGVQERQKTHVMSRQICHVCTHHQEVVQHCRALAPAVSSWKVGEGLQYRYNLERMRVSNVHRTNNYNVTRTITNPLVRISRHIFWAMGHTPSNASMEIFWPWYDLLKATIFGCPPLTLDHFGCVIKSVPGDVSSYYFVCSIRQGPRSRILRPRFFDRRPTLFFYDSSNYIYNHTS